MPQSFATPDWTLDLISDDPGLKVAVEAMLLRAAEGVATLRLIRPGAATAALRQGGADIVLIDADTAGDTGTLTAVARLLQTAPVVVLGHRLDLATATGQACLARGAAFVWPKNSGLADPLLAGSAGAALMARLESVRIEQAHFLRQVGFHV